MSGTILVMVSILFSVPPDYVSAQVVSTRDIQPQAARYMLGSRDEILMRVNVWGYVAKPGQYLVPRNTDLVTLMSFAGGPRTGADLKKVRIIRGPAKREVTESVNGGNGHGVESKYLTADVKRFVDTGDPALIPVIKGGDTVIIPQSLGNKVMSTVGLVSTITLLAQAAWWVTLIIRN